MFAWGVHLYTASGALCGLLALQAIHQGDPRRAFFWMFMAVIVDATDGFLARRARVEERLPHIDGRRLDDMVDYFTWVVTPVAFMACFGVLPAAPLLWGMPLLASGLGMSNDQAKTEDDFFLGFPSLWNVVALYLWLWGLPGTINAAIVVFLSMLVLVPTRYVYPSKTRPLRFWTNFLMGIWLAQLMASFLWPERFGGRLCMAATMLFPIYYLGLSFYLDRTLPRKANGSAPREGV